ncbi:HK97 family phage prohead protease [Mesorhizobium yinganensis]|uniref:HK97 family phage prohead protease n=1 Tax=Mesorhizobium yinganensis TaxID=3157707 RepID=UPI0032B76232
MKVNGYALPWNRAIQIDGLWEMVRPNAVRIDTRNVRLCFMHEGHDYPLAQTANGTLQLWNDAFGLAWAADVDDAVGWKRAALRTIGDGSTSDCSVNFTFLQCNERDGLRVIEAADIDHVAVCARLNGAYGDEGANCWLEDKPSDAFTRRLAQRWAAGASNRALSPGLALANRSASAARLVAVPTCRPSASPASSWRGKVPPSVDHVLRMAGRL